MSYSAGIAIAPPNLYVNLDQALPTSVRLRVGQNVVLVGAAGRANGRPVRKVDLPANHFSPHQLQAGVTLSGQPANTAVVAMAMSQAAGSGVITIEFAARPPVGLGSPYAPIFLSYLIS